MILSAIGGSGAGGGGRGCISASINALSGVSNGLMNILFILIWRNRCCVNWLQSSRAEKATSRPPARPKENVLNQNIQAGQNLSEPGKQKQVCSPFANAGWVL